MTLKFFCYLHFLQYIQCFNSCNSEETTASKRRKLSKENVDGECVNGDEVEEATASSCDANDGMMILFSFFLFLQFNCGFLSLLWYDLFVITVAGDVEEGPSSPVKVDTDGDTGPLLKLVKLTKSGLLLFIFAKNISSNVVEIVSKILRSVESGSSGSLLWVHNLPVSHIQQFIDVLVDSQTSFKFLAFIIDYS